MHTLKTRELPSNILRYVLLLLGGAVSVMPMIYMISTSLKPNGALYEFPPKFFPALDTVTLENYVYFFSQEKFYVNFLNSAIVAILTVVIAAFVSSALAFCLARFRFPGRRALFALVIGTMIIPGTTLIITQYQLASFFKLTNKLLGLVPFYVAWVIPFSTFMIKGYIESIPREFDEAVYMDGGSVFTVFFNKDCKYRHNARTDQWRRVFFDGNLLCAETGPLLYDGGKYGGTLRRLFEYLHDFLLWKFHRNHAAALFAGSR